MPQRDLHLKRGARPKAPLREQPSVRDDRSLLDALVGDGRPLLLFTGLALLLSGFFAIFQASTGHFLPHDEYFLGMDAAELCAYYQCRVLHFMIHDRVAFAGALVAIGILYMWLAEFPLRQHQGWAWWAFVLSGAAGFASFLTYLGYSYLDTWHGVATLGLLPCWIVGLVRAYQTVQPPSLRQLWQGAMLRPDWRTRAALGNLFLLMTVAGLLGAGLFILFGGMTRVFVPQDLEYMGLTVADLHAISPQLVPLIAHDRSGFGGALFCAGVVMGFCLLFATPSRSLWQSFLLAGLFGFGCALGVHFPVGYNNLFHLLPAYLGSAVFGVGMVLSYESMVRGATSVAPTPLRRAP
jgi:hypothetical protein